MAYAGRGWPVFPLHSPVDAGCSCGKPNCASIGKHPRTPRGLLDASTDVSTVERWWTQLPDANVGLRTGVWADVLDLDTTDAVVEFESMVRADDGDPKALPSVFTAKGMHFYFQATGGQNLVGFRPGWDWRGVNGYVVAPPSVHAKGSALYEWRSPIDGALPAAPEWLLHLLRKRPLTKAPVEEVLVEGQRNATLASLAGLMRRPGMSASAIEAALLVENQERCQPPLDDEEVHRIAVSVGRYAPAGPASLPCDEKEPWPLRKDLPKPEPTPTLPAELVPGPWRPWLIDAADRAKLPLEYLAAPAVVAAGNIIGRQLAIRPNQFDDFLVVANLWGAIVGPSGDMKTQAIAEGTRPIFGLAREAMATYQLEVEGNVSAMERLGLEIKVIKDRLHAAVKAGKAAEMDDAEDKLRVKHEEAAKLEIVERRYVTQDSTVAKLGELLRENPRGLLVLRDELTGLLRMMDQPGREGEREFYLEGWNGTGDYTFDRIGRGTIHIPALCLGLFGGIQPGKLRRYVAEAVLGGWGADGLLQRLQILVWPDALPPWERPHRWPDGKARARATECFSQLDHLDPSTLSADQGANDLPFLTFAPDAQELYDAFRDELEGHLRGGIYADAPAFNSHLAKYRSLLPALALTFHLIEVVSGGAAGPVSLQATQLGAAWVDFLEQHARKVYAEELDPVLSTAAVLAQRIEKGQVPDRSSLRDIYRHGWSGLTDPERVRAGLTVLVSAGWVRVVDIADPSGGRPSEVIRIHPELRDKAAGQGGSE